MLAAGQRDGAVIIVAVILLLLALVAVFMWVQSSRREPLPHAAPPAARTELRTNNPEVSRVPAWHARDRSHALESQPAATFS
jgi:hypothetical protein